MNPNLMKTVIVDLLINVETEKYSDMEDLMKSIKSDLQIEQLICTDKELFVDDFSVEKIRFYDESQKISSPPRN
jgi:hypothetical protein